MNILLLEQPTRNKGDESAHRGLVCLLLKTYPQAKIVVPFYGNTTAEIDAMRVESERVTYVDIPNRGGFFAYHRWIKLFLMLRLCILMYLLPTTWTYLKYIRWADVVVGAPGGIEMGGFMGWSHVALLRLVKMEGKKCFYFGRSIGPFSENNYLSKLFKRQCIDLFKYFSFLSLRDTFSQKVADELKLHYVSTIDSAFLRDVQCEIPSVVTNFVGKSKYFVFVPNSLSWHPHYRENYTVDDFRSFWSNILNRIMEEYTDYKVVMLPQTTAVSWIYEGYPFFMDIRNSLQNSDRVMVLADDYGSDVQQMIISQAEFLVGARYHSVIFSINQAVPFISLSYEHKMSGVLNMLGKNDCEIRIDALLRGSRMSEIDVDELATQIVEMTHTIQSDSKAKIHAQELALCGFRRFTESVENVLKDRR